MGRVVNSGAKTKRGDLWVGSRGAVDGLVLEYRQLNGITFEQNQSMRTIFFDILEQPTQNTICHHEHFKSNQDPHI